MNELPESVYEQVKSLSKEGDELVNENLLTQAVGKYIDALKLLPGDRKTWEAATWLYVAIGDIHFKDKKYDKCFMCFVNAVQCANGLGNPYIHLRLGQMYFEQENFDKAADELTRAYMGAGLDIFLEDDPKYIDFLETKIEI